MMATPRIILLAARTYRSVSYIRSLFDAGIPISMVAVYGPDGNYDSSMKRVFDSLGIGGGDNQGDTFEEFVRSCGFDFYRIESDFLPDKIFIDFFKITAPDLVVYSGYGGQIVPNELLDVSPFLHVHSGWLPDYRGSTTLYYSLLNESRCACSALLLDSSIDTGPVIARKYYPAPVLGVDVDREYDSAIRSDLLIDVLNDYVKRNFFCFVDVQVFKAKTYYVIHPVLKHLALLSLAGNNKGSLPW